MLVYWFSCRHTEAVAVGKLGRYLDGDLVLVPGQPRHVPEAAAQVGRPAATEAAPHTGAARAAQPLVTAVQVTCGHCIGGIDSDLSESDIFVTGLVMTLNVKILFSGHYLGPSWD